MQHNKRVRINSAMSSPRRNKQKAVITKSRQTKNACIGLFRREIGGRHKCQSKAVFQFLRKRLIPLGELIDYNHRHTNCNGANLNLSLRDKVILGFDGTGNYLIAYNIDRSSVEEPTPFFSLYKFRYKYSLLLVMQIPLFSSQAADNHLSSLYLPLTIIQSRERNLHARIGGNDGDLAVFVTCEYNIYCNLCAINIFNHNDKHNKSTQLPSRLYFKMHVNYKDSGDLDMYVKKENLVFDPLHHTYTLLLDSRTDCFYFIHFINSKSEKRSSIVTEKPWFQQSKLEIYSSKSADDSNDILELSEQRVLDLNELIFDLMTKLKYNLVSYTNLVYNVDSTAANSMTLNDFHAKFIAILPENDVGEGYHAVLSLVISLTTRSKQQPAAPSCKLQLTSVLLGVLLRVNIYSGNYYVIQTFKNNQNQSQKTNLEQKSKSLASKYLKMFPPHPTVESSFEWTNLALLREESLKWIVNPRYPYALCI